MRNIIITSFFIGFCFTKIFSQADLMITPIRVLFDGKKQRETLNLINVGKDSATYTISFIEYDMTEEGGMLIIKDTSASRMLASSFLRVFPRQVTLAPGESQSVALQLKRNNSMVDGEYRSHLYFRAEENYEPLGEKKQRDTTSVSVKLKPIYGISTAVIVRNGKCNVEAGLSNLNIVNLPDSTTHLKMTINRKGNISLYGDIIVEYLPEKGKPFTIATVKGLGVYTNIEKRNVSIRLNITPGMDLNYGKINVKYINAENKNKQVYAEEIIELSN